MGLANDSKDGGLASPLYLRGKQAPIAMMPTRFAALLIGAWVVTVATPHSACAAPTAFELAQQRYEQQDWEAARQLFVKTAEESLDEKSQLSAQFYAAECALQLKDYPRAQAEYQRVLEAEVTEQLRVRASFRLAEASHLAGDLQGSLVAFQQFVEKYPGDELTGEARNYLGEILLEQGRHESALAAFVYVIENCRGFQVDRARLGMARCLLASNRLDEVPITLGRLCQGDDPKYCRRGLAAPRPQQV